MSSPLTESAKPMKNQIEIEPSDPIFHQKITFRITNTIPTTVAQNAGR